MIEFCLLCLICRLNLLFFFLSSSSSLTFYQLDSTSFSSTCCSSSPGSPAYLPPPVSKDDFLPLLPFNPSHGLLTEGQVTHHSCRKLLRGVMEVGGAKEVGQRERRSCDCRRSGLESARARKSKKRGDLEKTIRELFFRLSKDRPPRSSSPYCLEIILQPL